jgi:hypothetical protein
VTAERILRWQWTLANGGNVTAVIDLDASTESVSQGDKVLSSCARGAKPEGHTVTVAPEGDSADSERPPMEAVITFSPGAPICILRVDGHEIAPRLWPVRQRQVQPTKAQIPIGAYVLLGVVAVALVIGGVVVRSLRKEAPPPRADGRLTQTHRSGNGLFVAHYPDDLEPKPAILPPSAGGVVLEDKAKATSIVIGALPLGESERRDPWILQQRLRDEALANLSKGGARYDEVARREETCVGKPGAVVTAQLVSRGTRTAKIWSCAFVHDTAGYIVLYMLAEPVETADERRARAIVEATELTKLTDLGVLPPAIRSGDLPMLGAPGTGSLPPLELPR